MKSTGILGVLIAFAILGCATSNLPRGARLVGGGLDIEYQAPVPGTVILMERTSGRIIATETLEEGDAFRFGSADVDSSPVLKSMMTLTNQIGQSEYPSLGTNTNFQLFFVPR